MEEFGKPCGEDAFGRLLLKTMINPRLEEELRNTEALGVCPAKDSDAFVRPPQRNGEIVERIDVVERVEDLDQRLRTAV